jgi:hypothetical protein
MKKIVVHISLLLAIGCSSTKPQPVYSSKDSTNTVINTKTVEVVKDSFIFIPPDEANIKALLECDSNGKVLVKQLLDYKAGKHAEPPIFVIQDNILDIDNITDSFSIYMSWKERFTSSDTNTVKDRLVTITLPPERIYYNTWWDRLFIKAGKASLVLLLLYGCYKLLTNRFKIISTVAKWVA